MRDLFAHRVLEAAICLASGKPAASAAIALLRAFDAIDSDQGRTANTKRRSPVSREALSLASDGALSLLAAEPVDAVSSKLLAAWGCLLDPLQGESRRLRRGPRTANAPRAEALLWNRRLAAWKTDGGASPFTRLLDRIVDLILRGRTAISPEEAAARIETPAPSESKAPGYFWQLRILDDGQQLVIGANEFLAIEEQVRWIDGPTGKLGIVGGRPFVTTGAVNVTSNQAIRRMLDGQEVLTPFQRLEVLENQA